MTIYVMQYNSDAFTFLFWKIAAWNTFLFKTDGVLYLSVTILKINVQITDKYWKKKYIYTHTYH